MNVVSKSKLARLAGVSPAAVTKACRGRLASGLVGDRVNLDAPCVQAFLEGHAVKLPRSASVDTSEGREAEAGSAREAEAEPTPSVPATDIGAPGETPVNAEPQVKGLVKGDAKEVKSFNLGAEQASAPAPTDVAAYADMTLRELVQTFGTERAFKDWLEALKKIEDIREKRLNNEELHGRLISRELVRTHVFGMIDATFRRLLTDIPKTVSRRLYASAKGGVAIEDAERTVRELLTSVLTELKTNAVRTLRNGKNPAGLSSGHRG